MKLTWLVAASGLAFAASMSVPAQAAPSLALGDFAPAAQQTSGVKNELTTAGIGITDTIGSIGVRECTSILAIVTGTIMVDIGTGSASRQRP